MIEQPDWLVAARRRPKLRGVLHQYAFFVSLLLGVALIAGAEPGRERVAVAVFAASVSAMLGISALYHRVIWPPGPRRWIRRLDHAAIFLLIAGTYTPFGLLALERTWRVVVLSIVWSGALAAIVLKVAWVDAPRWVVAGIAVALGWVGVFAVPKIHESTGLGTLVLLAIGGVLYTAGAIIYARRRPDPIPNVFGYHELFHALVVAAAGCQYASVALFVL
ncbi:MAG TPA: hemolysin III family protein [Gaiellaceae bacterium]|nr:hemolysin III family protein [Gaiellaceae bacterium]